MEELINTRLLTYDIKVSRSISNVVRLYGYTDTTTLSVVITNLICCIKKNNKLVYSRDTGGLKTKSKKDITYTSCKMVVRQCNY